MSPYSLKSNQGRVMARDGEELKTHRFRHRTMEGDLESWDAGATRLRSGINSNRQMIDFIN